MTEDEICDMVIECIKAAKERKKLQYYNTYSDKWEDIANAPITDTIHNIYYGTKYRVKPEPKTVRARMYWCKGDYAITGPYTAVGKELDNIPYQFRIWAGDEQILIVPEV